MAENSKFSLFGFRIGKKEEEKQPSFAPPSNEDGATTVTSAAQFGVSALDLDGAVKNEVELITRYREMAMQPEIESAIDDIVNEAIVHDDNGKSVEIIMDELKQPDKLKNAIKEEFDNIIRLLNYDNMGTDIFRRYYIDGRLNYHVMIDVSTPQKGILELRYIDPRKIKKVREIKKQKDEKTGVEIVASEEEYYVYSDKISSGPSTTTVSTISGIKIAPDSIISINSGLMDAKRGMVLSYLHKAIKPLNQLRMIEDAVVIYRLSRAPERRIFYIDVGNLPRPKAEQHVRDMMTKYKNKLVYDSCLDMNTLIPLMDGRTLSLYEIQEEFESGKELWIYSCDPTTGKFAPGLVSSAGVTKFDQKVLKITLDNGKTITCTYDHKFPVWNKGKVEAKNLQIGDSMVPHYTREKNIISGSRSSYEQIFENESKKWQFTHRLVSKWKDEVGMNNEWTFDESYSEFNKQTIHHIDYNRYNNSPLNLTRMYRDDHFAYHKQHNSLAGKIGGSVTAKKRKELGIDYFFMTKEQKSEHSKKSGHIGGKSSYKNKSGIHGLTKEQTIINSKKGVAELLKLFENESFRKDHSNKIKEGFTPEGLEKLRINRLNLPREHFVLMSEKGNKSRWSNPISKTNHSAKQTTVYTKNIFEVVENAAKLGLSSKKSIEYINNTIDFNSWIESNKNNKIRNKDLTRFIDKDLNRICRKNGFKSWREYKESFQYKNHKIVNIEFLEETMDVGTLGIDKNEIYHDYHTFALDAGIYTCNSTGMVRDDRRHLSMVEDFWIPRREGKTTEITTLQGGQSLGKLEDVEYFEKKLYKSLNVPVTRLDPSQAVSIGRSTEITRDELKFAKFVAKLRNKFAELFDQALRVQLVLKGICTEEEWQTFKETISYDFIKDNNFVELKEAELMQERLGILAIIDQYSGKYYSKKWIQQHILRLNDIEIADMEKEIDEEKEESFKDQAEDQVKQIQIQAQGVELQSKLMPNPEVPVEAGQEQEEKEQPPQKRNQANPYDIR